MNVTRSTRFLIAIVVALSLIFAALTVADASAPISATGGFLTP